MVRTVTANNRENPCPYCGKTILEQSRDHIFPQFLGGRREIICCKRCNDVFGHTFEAEAAKYLQHLHVFISSWGVPLRSADPTWRGAYVHEGRPLDLSVGETGVKTSLSKPLVHRDESGQIAGIEFEDRDQAEEAARRLVEKGKAKDVRIQEVPATQPTLEGLEIDLQIGPALRRVALKMCIGVSTFLPEFVQEDVATATQIVLADPYSKPPNTLVAFARYDGVDALRPALSHLVFVERSERRTYALVQFFGVVQLFCRLGIPKQHAPQAALFGFLDPVAGEEVFSTASPLNIEEPPDSILIPEYPNLMQRWLVKFRDEAVKRGATHPPDLKQVSLKIS